MSHKFEAFSLTDDGRVVIAADSGGRIAGNFANLVAATGIGSNAKGKVLSLAIGRDQLTQLSAVEVPSLEGVSLSDVGVKNVVTGVTNSPEQGGGRFA